MLRCTETSSANFQIPHSPNQNHLLEVHCNRMRSKHLGRSCNHVLHRDHMRIICHTFVIRFVQSLWPCFLLHIIQAHISYLYLCTYTYAIMYMSIFHFLICVVSLLIHRERKKQKELQPMIALGVANQKHKPKPC